MPPGAFQDLFKADVVVGLMVMLRVQWRLRSTQYLVAVAVVIVAVVVAGSM